MVHTNLILRSNYVLSGGGTSMPKCPFFNAECLETGCQLWVTKEDLENRPWGAKGRSKRAAGDGMCAIKFNAIVYG